MKVLFAFNSEESVNQLVEFYKKTYGEKIEATKVYFFRSLIDTLRKNKNFDRVVIHEELEPFGSKNQDAIDKYLFNNLDKASDEAGRADIIVICTERRQQNDKFVKTLFNLGIYNILTGQDRTFGKVSELINRPRTKKDAKMFIDVDLEENPYEAADKIDELELRNIIKYYEKNIFSKEKIVSGFDSLYEQYTFEKLKQIVPFLPMKAREVLERESQKYIALMAYKPPKAGKGEKVRVVEVPVYIQQEPVKKPDEPPVYKPEPIPEEKPKPVVEPPKPKIKYNPPPVIEEEVELPKPRGPIVEPKVEIKKEEPKIEKGPIVEEKSSVIENIVTTVAAPVVGVIEEIKEKKEADEPKVELPKVEIPVVEKVKKPEPVVEKFDDTFVSKKVEIKDTDKDISSVKVQKFDEMYDVKPPVVEPKIEKVEPKVEIELPKVEPKVERVEPKVVIEPPVIESKVEKAEPKVVVEPPVVEPKIEKVESKVVIEPPVIEPKVEKIEPKVEIELPKVEPKVEKVEPKVVIEPPVVEPKIEKVEPKVVIELPKDESKVEKVEPKVVIEPPVVEPKIEKVEPKVVIEPPVIEPKIEKVEPKVVVEPPVVEPKIQRPEPKVVVEPPVVEPKIQKPEPKVAEPPVIEPKIQRPEPKVVQPEVVRPEPARPAYTPPPKYQPPRPMVEEPRIQTVTQVIEKEVIKEVYDTPRDYKKAVCFVGAHKTGTTFIINAIANVLSNKGVKVAILDLTNNKDSYLIYSNRDLDQKDIAANSLSNLAIGQDRPLKLGNLSIYTGIPRTTRNKIDVYRAIEIAKREHSVVLIDCDFTTKKDVPDVFRYAQSIYVVQDMDMLNILPITMFLKELKIADVDYTKISVIINKYIKSSIKIDDILGSLAYYTSPDFSVMEEDLLPKKVNRFIVPFDEQNYLRYIENISSGKMNFSGFSDNFKQAISIIIQDVFPIGTRPMSRPPEKTGFIKSIFGK